MSRPGPQLDAWLARVRRRIRVRRGLRWTGAALVAWAGASVAGLLFARVEPVGWEETAVVLALPFAVVVPFIAGIVQKLPIHLTARAADRDLASADRLGTATEFDATRQIDLEREQVSDATRYATAHGPRSAAPIRLPERRLLIAAGLAVVAIALMVLENPMDAEIERREAEQALLEQAAENIEEGAREIEQAPISENEKRRLLQELEQLAEELRDAPSIDEALKELLESERRLAALQQGDHIAAKTLMRSFERSLEENPLTPGGAGSAAEQLSQLAAEMDEMPAEQRGEAAERLAQLGESLQGLDPELAAALEAAAGSLAEGGDPQAVSAAASALQAAQASIAAQESIAATAAQLGSLGDQLAAASAALAQGQLPGQGQAAGQGLGAGQGAGQSQGAGQGQGQGQGTQAGAASGQVSGTNANSSTGATGGPGTANGTGNNPSKAGDDAPVFDPIFGEEIAERLRVAGADQGGRNTELGTQIGQGRDGDILIPYSFVYPEWSARAARSVDTLPIPASLRAFVRAYFRSLAPEEG